MPGKLAAALTWAARGFRVFPVNADTRGGPGEYPLGAGWTEYATNDPSIISKWWTDPVLGSEQDYNIGCLTDDLVVVDVDVKAGKPGLATFFDLGLEFDTLTVRTTTGGYHAYFAGPGRPVGGAPLGPGLDVRAYHGYVLAPGSTLSGVPYVVEIDAPLSQLPEKVASTLRAPRERAAHADLTNVQLDDDTAVAFAVDYLSNAPLAIEGANGDDTTYRVACKVRDFGISELMCWSLLADHWNDRCAPPWSQDELEGKVFNAYAYATGTIGIAHPATAFGSVDMPAVQIASDVPPGVFEPGRALHLRAIPPRPWVMNRLLIRRAVTTLVATGSAGKSTLILTIAAHLALGKDFLSFKNRVGPAKSIIYNAEDDLEEISRRLLAVCQVYQFDFDAVSRQLIILTGDDFQFMLTEGTPPTLKEDHVGKILAAASDPQVALASLDPLVEIHTAIESDNNQMRYVMSIARFIARRADVSVLIGHHTKKPLAAGSGYSGDADASRGATAIINSSRVALTLSVADGKDVDKWGIKEDDLTRFVRLDDAKMNLSLANSRPVWLKREGVALYNGDEVGALVPADLDENLKGSARIMARVFHAEMTQNSRASLGMPEAITTLQAGDPLYAQLAPKTVKSRIERFLAEPVELEGGNRIRLHRELKGTGQVVTVVLE